MKTASVLRAIGALALVAAAAPAQTSSAKLEFEVASIKPAAPQEPGRPIRIGAAGGPGTTDPGQLKYSNASLQMLIMQAYNVKRFQVTAPDWMNSAQFDIVAKVPPGASKEDVRVMLQNLLAERFQMKVHMEKKEMQAYALVAAKGGVKLKPSENATPGELPAAFNGPPAPPKMDRNGFPMLPPNMSGGALMMFNGSQMRMTASKRTMANICDFLSGQLSKPVVDQTGLTGTYDFNLEFAPDGPLMGPGGAAMPPPPPPPPGATAGMVVGVPGGAAPGGPPPGAGDPAPTLLGAVQDQLGLKLEPKKLPVDIVVVDHAEKTPTEN